jgi:hypothetical protein
MDPTSHRRERLAALVRKVFDEPEAVAGQLLMRATVVTLLVLTLTIASRIHAARSAYAPWVRGGTDRVEVFVTECIARVEAWDRSIRNRGQHVGARDGHRP